MARHRATRMKGFGSKLEYFVSKRLKKLKIPFTYESMKLDYVVRKTYTPDFVLDDGTIIEVKGVLLGPDRVKMAAVKQDHPDLLIVFIFQKPNNKVPGLKKTHAQWAEQYGYPWLDHTDFTKRKIDAIRRKHRKQTSDLRRLETTS